MFQEMVTYLQHKMDSNITKSIRVWEVMVLTMIYSKEKGNQSTHGGTSKTGRGVVETGCEGDI
jgi:hypothetical protein